MDYRQYDGREMRAVERDEKRKQRVANGVSNGLVLASIRMVQKGTIVLRLKIECALLYR